MKIDADEKELLEGRVFYLTSELKDLLKMQRKGR